METRRQVGSGAPWEDVVGYSRAVRVGRTIEVSGTAAVDEQGQVVAPGDPYGQTVYIIAKIARALEALGGTLADVTRTRIYVTDIRQWQEIGRAHGEAFAKIKPATSMVQVTALIAPQLIVELEMTAVVDP